MRIYLDHNATTPLRGEALAVMTDVLQESYGNPSSTHLEGARARERVERARAQVAHCLGAREGSIYFTSGATEANNALLHGIAAARPGARVVTTTIEHPSVEAPLAAIERSGLKIVRVEVDGGGRVDVDALEASLTPDTALVTVIWANNETGVIQPIHEIADRVHERGLALHVDATQAVGKLPVDLNAVAVDYLSCSAHKLNGPKGVGCLVMAGAVDVEPFSKGGGQERGWRGGTENVAGIAGFGEACALASQELESRIERWTALRDRLWDGIRARVPDVRRNGSPTDVLCNTLNVELRGVAGEALLQALDLSGVAVSAGAACHSGSISPSRVLLAMGRTPEEARGSLRLSVGLGVDEAQVDRAVELLEALARQAREADAL